MRPRTFLLNRPTRSEPARGLGPLILIAAAVGAFTFAALSRAISVDDSAGYLTPARSWAAGQGLSEGGRPLEARLPLYPLALGILIRLFGDSPVVISFFNAGCHLGAVLFVWVILRRKVDRAVADIAAAAAMVYPPLLTSTGLILQESFLSLLLAALFYTLWRAVESGATGWICAAGVVLGLSGLAKSTSLPLVVPAAVLVALAPRRAPPSRTNRWRAAQAAMLTASVLVVLMPWAVRNLRLLGRLEVTNNNGGHTFLGGTVSNTITDWSSFPEYLAATKEWAERGRASQPVLDRYLYSVAWRRIAAAPGRWLGLVLERSGRFMLPARHWFVAAGLARTGTFPPWYLALTAINAALFLAAARLIVRAVRWADWPLLVAPLIVFVHQAVYAVTYVSPRYGVTVGPVLIGAAILAIAAGPTPAVSER